MLHAYYKSNGRKRTLVIAEDGGNPFGYSVSLCPGCGVEIVDHTGHTGVWNGTGCGGSLHCSDACRKKRAAELARRRYVPAEPQERPCAHCGKLFAPRRSDAKTCSVRCRTALHRADKKEAVTRTA